MPGVVKDLYLVKDWSSLQEKAKVSTNFNDKSEKSLRSSAQSLYQKALESKKKGDEEMCYVCCMRFIELVSHIKKKYKSSESDRELMINCKELIECAEELSKKLKKRYDLKSKAKTPAVQIVNLPQPVLSPPSQPVQTDHQPAGDKGDTNGVSGYNFITNQELYGWMNSHLGASGLKKSLLIIDLRPSKDYENSHFKSDRFISIPEEVIEKGKTAKYYGSCLQPQFKALWDERKFVDHVVLVDWSATSPDLQENSAIDLFKKAIETYDQGAKYESRINILDGGFERWAETYPNQATSRIQRPSKETADAFDINEISFPNLSESPKEWFNGGERSPYNQNRQVPFPTSKPPAVDRSSKANAQLLYERNQFDQQQLEKDIHESKNKLDQLEFQLIGNETKELLDEKKKWEEKYSELEKEHQIKEEENERLRREIEKFKQRERIAAARQAPKPGITQITISDEPSQITDSIKASDEEKPEERPSPQEPSKDVASNDDLSQVPLNEVEDDNALLKRSRSTPNIAQVPPQDWERPPIYDRSTKPVLQSHGYGSSQRVYISNRMSGLTGLRNLGNTCYMNSIIQCISNTSKLAEYFCSGRYQSDLNPTRGEIAHNLALVIRELWCGEYRSTACHDLKRVVGRHCDTFAGTSQQDSHEFLTFLMDWLHNDLCRTPGKRQVKQELLSGPKMAWAEYKKASNSFISELFFVQQVSTVVCKNCHEKSVTYEEPTSNLTLQLPSANNRCTLADCLRLYTTGEPISGYRCDSCEQTNDAMKKVDIWRLPQILVIHLKRFYSDGFYHKRQTLVDFPLKGLDMRQFTANTETLNTKYDLYAVSNHYGTLEGGHYTAFCRNKEKWYKFDDQDVTETSPSYVKSANAYILFYEQTQTTVGY